MKKLVLLVSLLGGFFASSAMAADCVSQAEMKEIASHFTQLKEYAKADYCYDGSETSHLIATIMFMRKTEFKSDMAKSSDELFSGRFSSSWYNYFIGRITDFEIPSSCPKGVAAYVYMWGTTMYACPAMLTDNFAALDRASIMMHEARHIDGFPHTTCSTGPRKGLQGACDKKISDGGSYAVTVETYAQLAKYAVDLHPALKAYSLASAVTYADETFETPARVDREEKLLLMDDAKNFATLNLTTGQMENLGQTPALGRLVPRAQHLILFPEDKSLPAKYVFTKNEGDIMQAAGDAVLEYNAQTPAERADLVGLHIAAQWTAKVYSQKIVFGCSAKSNATSTAVIPDGRKVSGILYMNGYDRVSRMHSVITEDGVIYDFGCTEAERPVLQASTVKLDQKFKRIHKVGGKVIGLSQDGRLFSIANGKSTEMSTSLDGHIFEIAPRQSFGFMNAQ